MLDGIDTAPLAENQRAALRGPRIGFDFQAFHLIDQRSATENAALGLLNRRTQGREARARDYLERVRLAHRKDAPPATIILITHDERVARRGQLRVKTLDGRLSES